VKVKRISYPLSQDALQDVPDIGQTIAIGDFDGVHLGHRQVIEDARQAGNAAGLATAVMTFHPHPRQVLGSPVYASYLTPLERKLIELERLGVDRAYVVQFDRELSSLSPSDFVEQVLIPLGAKRVVVGFNFSFGHKGAGSSQLLAELSKERFRVNIVEPFQLDGERISSTLIRSVLAQGEAARAERLLGRPYEVGGNVVRGEGRGRTIGVPTANLSPDGPYVVPATGVYAVTVRLATGEMLKGVMNVGKKPTFHADLPHPTWEVHLFDFDGDLYGQRLDIQFRHGIRSERKFESVDALIRQIQDDIVRAKTLLQHTP
jgi:riboflavin kinase / FMN adenylyltransferase